jgi:hypothetical protein
MSLDIEFLQAYVAFLKNAFPANLDAKVTIERTDIMVYALTATLCSLVGTKLDFLDFVSQGRPGGGGPHVEQGGAGGGGPHRLQKLVSYATEVSTPALANAFRNSHRAG